MSPSLESFVNIKSVIDEIDLWNNTRSSMGFDGDLIHSVASGLSIAEVVRHFGNAPVVASR